MSDFSQMMLMKATGKLAKDELWRRIQEFLKKQTMCSLCTCRANVPRATPLEYYLHGTTLYMVGHKGKKLANLRANPQVSIGIYDHVHPTWGDAGNWLGVKGAVVTGRARLVTDDDPEYAEAHDRFASPTMAKYRPGEKPRGRVMIVVEMEQVEYQDIALKFKGLDSKQVWKAPRARSGKE
jgi:nitroimidazol reductase NimA-like FMN-containing flavoprotein (pyridoxamine 5'-phosphate oxidase superfamily)